MTVPLYYMTGSEIAQALHRRELSSVELTEAHLERIGEIEPRLGAFLTVTSELALEQARAADMRFTQGTAGPLTGIPMQLKDNISTEGVNTTCGSTMLANYVPPYDATVARKLKEAGTVLLGKGNMDEFAMGSSTENSAFKITSNPWDFAKVPGGSSGGPACAVAAGESVFSLGSDTGGSIRQPAALCGAVGLKPTYGLVSRYGLVAFASSLDQIGPLTRSVEDSALVLNAITGHDPMDSTSISGTILDYTEGLEAGIKGLKIGVVKEYMGSSMDPNVIQLIQKAALQFENLGAKVDWDVSLPMSDKALAVYYILAPSECSANLARYDGVKYGYSAQETQGLWAALEETRRVGFGPEVQRRILLGTYALSAGYYDAYYLQAQKVRTLIRREFAQAFKKWDLLLTPTAPSVAFGIGEKTADPIAMHASDICTVPVNIAGIPAISLTCGFSENLPVGLQLIGPNLSERALLRAAYAYQQTTDWHLQHPIP